MHPRMMGMYKYLLIESMFLFYFESEISCPGQSQYCGQHVSNGNEDDSVQYLMVCCVAQSQHCITSQLP